MGQGLWTRRRAPAPRDPAVRPVLGCAAAGTRGRPRRPPGCSERRAPRRMAPRRMAPRRMGPQAARTGQRHLRAPTRLRPSPPPGESWARIVPDGPWRRVPPRARSWADGRWPRAGRRHPAVPPSIALTGRRRRTKLVRASGGIRFPRGSSRRGKTGDSCAATRKACGNEVVQGRSTTCCSPPRRRLRGAGRRERSGT